MKNWLKTDAASGLAKRATEILFIQSPIATSMGVMCGFFIEVIVNAFKPLWDNSKIISFASINIYSYVFSGIFICNLVSLIFSLSRRKKLAPEIEDAFALIQLTKKQGKLPEYQIRLMYTNLAERVLESVTINNLSVSDSKKKSPSRRSKPSSD